MRHFCTSSVVLIITSEHAILNLDCLKRDETEQIEHKYKCTAFIVKETKCLDLYMRLSTHMLGELNCVPSIQVFNILKQRQEWERGIMKSEVGVKYLFTLCLYFYL